MYRARWLVPAVALSVVGAAAFAAEYEGKEAKEKEALAKDVKGAKVSLERVFRPARLRTGGRSTAEVTLVKGRLEDGEGKAGLGGEALGTGR